MTMDYNVANEGPMRATPQDDNPGEYEFFRVVPSIGKMGQLRDHKNGR